VIQVLRSKQNWLLTLYNGLAFSPIAIFGGLWGNPFLEQAYQLSKTETASMVSLVFIGLGLGSPLLGMFSDRLGHRRDVMFVSTLVGCAAISLVLYCHPMPTWLLGSLLFIFGFALGAFMLVFAIGKELNPLFLTATVISMINTSEVVLDGIAEPGIGKLLDMSWDGTIVNGVHVFTLYNYHMALSILPLFLLSAAFLLLGVKKK
jgi:MFS family permease